MTSRVSIDLDQAPASQRAALKTVSQLLKHQKARGYVVGGFLRDHLIGRPTGDIDLVVDGIAPGDVGRVLVRTLGLSGPIVYPRFKTVLVVGAGLEVEICRLQGSLANDASRRDFTINCLYLDLASRPLARGGRRILDPTGRGLCDLEARRLRAPQDASRTLWLDPLRILRAVRFFAAYGLRLDPALRNAMDRMAYLVTRPAVERIRTELERILVSPRLMPALRLMQQTGINAALLPELAETDGFSQETPYHAYDLFTHLAKTAARMPPVATLRFAGLLHDVGKLTTRAARGDRMVYYGHEDVSRQVAAAITKRLRFSNEAARLIVFLAGNHMVNYSRAWSDRAVRRFVRRMGADLEQVLTLAEADRRSQRPVKAHEAGVWDLRKRVEHLRSQRPAGHDLPVDGRDIMRILGLAPGPRVGEAKAFLLDEALKRRRRMTRAEAARLLLGWNKPGDLETECIHVDKPLPA